MTNKCTERCWRASVIKEMQIKSTMDYQYTQIRITTIKETPTLSIGKDVSPFTTAARSVKWYNHFGKPFDSFLKS